MPSATDEIRAAIDAAGGAIRFDEFMRLALYGEHGFYTRRRTGRATRRLHHVARGRTAVRCGRRPGPRRRVGRGSGGPNRSRSSRPGPDRARSPGRSSRRVPPAVDALRYIAVEVSAAQRELHPPEVESVATMPDEVIAGVVFANELLDNLPFRLAVYDGDVA